MKKTQNERQDAAPSNQQPPQKGAEKSKHIAAKDAYCDQLLKKAAANKAEAAEKKQAAEKKSAPTAPAPAEQKSAPSIAEITETPKDKTVRPEVKISGRKTKAKILGLKGSFRLSPDTIFLTSFGKGNEALAEKHIIGTEVENIRNTFTVKETRGELVSIARGSQGSIIEIPYEDHNRLHAKAAIEREIFGREFEDTIHIQLASNILDVKKIFAQYAPYIVHTVNNLWRGYEEEETLALSDTGSSYQDDFLGMFPTLNSLTTAKLCYELRACGLVTPNRLASPYLPTKKGGYLTAASQYSVLPYDFDWSRFNYAPESIRTIAESEQFQKEVVRYLTAYFDEVLGFRDDTGSRPDFFSAAANEGNALCRKLIDCRFVSPNAMNPNPATGRYWNTYNRKPFNGPYYFNFNNLNRVPDEIWDFVSAARICAYLASHGFAKGSTDHPEWLNSAAYHFRKGDITENGKLAAELLDSGFLRCNTPNKPYLDSRHRRQDQPYFFDLSKIEAAPQSIRARLPAAPYQAAFLNKRLDSLGFRDDTGLVRPDNFTKAADAYKDILRLQNSAYYFPEALTDNRGNLDMKKAFAVIRLLGMLRQSSVHDNRYTATTFFRLEDIDADMKAALDAVLATRLSKLEKDFFANSRVNLGILHKLFPKEDLTKAYYDFSVRRDQLNLGFSLRTLREAMLDLDVRGEVRDPRNDPIRSKLYVLFDFLLYRYYRKNSSETSQIVELLRQSANEEQKSAVYLWAAEKRWENGMDNLLIDTLVPKLQELFKNNAQGLKALQKEDTSESEELRFSAVKDFSCFAKAMYTVSLLLDGGDMNTFLSALQSKLENIAALQEVLEDRQLPCDYRDDYRFFAHSRDYAEELRFIRSIARMSKGAKAIKKSDDKVKRKQYLDAAAVLGETNAEKVLNDFNPTVTEKENTSPHGFRNFIINNVINSRRFMYICRFMDPAKAKDIMACKPLVAWALRELPETQLRRYALSCGHELGNEPEGMITGLTSLLQNVSYQTFRDVPDAKAKVDAPKRERYKSLIGLYLTVLHKIVKSLVKVNMSYAMAFGLLERDSRLLESQFKREFPVSSHGAYTADYRCITAFFADRGWLNKRVKHYTESYARYYSDQSFRKYRNAIEHYSVLNALPRYGKELKSVKSIFDVFHYILFRYLEDAPYNGFTPAVINENLMDKMREHGTVPKNYLAALNAPFAYNAARYINLTVRKQFMEGYGR